MTTTTTSAKGGYRAVSAVLFLCLFASQAGAIALSPVLAEVARDLDVSTAAAGQLRTIAGLVARVTALALGRLGARVALGRQRLGGSLLLALGSLASAAAPSIGLLAAAQVPVGAGIGILTTAGSLAAAEWVPRERRAATLSWALIGQPAAWIVGMPLLGAAGERSWRWAWLAFPLVAALLAGAAVARRGGAPRASTAPARLRAALEAPRPGPLAGRRAAREFCLGRDARLLGCPFRRVLRGIIRGDGRCACRRRQRLRDGQPRAPTPRRR
jgi:predicted MFS family arabinose efflux permease